MKLNFEILTKDEVEKVHNASLAVLSKTGMKFDSEKLLEVLKRAGAKVCENIGIFP
jgi:trimethylamine--corrinoid protein Co-methyltransferase